MPAARNGYASPDASTKPLSPVAIDQDNPVLAALVFVIALVPLLLTPVLPLVDFYNHIARYFILANIDSIPALHENYRAAWAILPNIGLDVISTALMRVLPPTMVPHVTIIMIFGVQFGGMLYCNRALTGRTSVVTALLAVPLLYSFIFIWGFANFLLGLGLVFWGAGWWLRRRSRLLVALPVAALMAVVIFLVHGLAFGLYGILLGCLEIGIFLQTPGRRFADLVRAMLPLAAQAVVPLLLFRAAATASAAGGFTTADESVVRLSQAEKLGNRLWELLQYRLVTIVRVAEGPSLAFDIVSFVATAALIILLFRRGRAYVAPIAWPALAVAALLVVVVPPAMFGVGYVADRMPLFLAILFVASLGVRPGGGRIDRMITAGLAGLALSRLVAVALSWHGYAADNRDFAQVAAKLPPGALVETIMVGNARIDDAHRRCHMYGPLLIAEHGSVGRLFASKTAQPLELAGPLAATTKAAPRRPSETRGARGFWDDSIEIAATAGVPWILVCDGDRLTRPIPDFATPVASAGRFSLYRLSPPAGR